MPGVYLRKYNTQVLSGHLLITPHLNTGLQFLWNQLLFSFDFFQVFISIILVRRISENVFTLLKLTFEIDCTYDHLLGVMFMYCLWNKLWPGIVFSLMINIFVAKVLFSSIYCHDLMGCTYLQLKPVTPSSVIFGQTLYFDSASLHPGE